MVLKRSRVLAFGVLAFACGSDPNSATPSTSGGNGSGSESSAGRPSAGSGGVTGAGGNQVIFGGQTSSGGGSVTMPNEDPEETAEELREAACASWSAEPEALPAVLELVVDVSLSMDEKTPATGGRTKWEVTREALGGVIADLPPSTAVGMLYYPNRNTQGSQTPRDVSACVNVEKMLDVALLGPADSPARMAIAESLRETRPAGSTPTHDAYHYALVNGLERAQLPGNRFMVLITDGAPTLALQCLGRGFPQNPSPTDPIIEEVAAARERGIRTFIIGSPGTEVSVNGGDARPWMSRAAEVGGTAGDDCSHDGPNYCHIDLTQADDFGAALSEALAQVAGQVVSCRYTLPEPPPGQELDLDKINVIFTPGGGGPELIGRASASDCTEGYYVDENQEVVLCSASCDRVQADATASLEVLFGCESAPVKIK